MPLNLRYRPRALTDKELASALAATLQVLEALSRVEPERRWRASWFGLQILSPKRMKRPFVRHKIAYRLKAWIYALFFTTGDTLWSLLLLPMLYTFIGKKERENMSRPISMFLLKCDAEDLQDEAARRIGKVKNSIPQ